VSDTPAIPRFLAALLGVEVPAPAGPRVTVQQQQPPPPSASQPPAPQTQGPVPRLPAPSTPRRAAPDDAPRMRIGRRPDPLEQRKEPESREARGVRTQVPSVRSTVAPVRDAVRRTLATPQALRSAVLVAEILGSPRALRPYGADERA
jgi:hypothetical protein